MFDSHLHAQYDRNELKLNDAGLAIVAVMYQKLAILYMVPSEAHANLFSTSQVSQENLVTCNEVDVNASSSNSNDFSDELVALVLSRALYGWASAHSNVSPSLKPVKPR